MNLTTQQIQAIKLIQPWYNTEFHGNKTHVDGIPVELHISIVEKKRLRDRLKNASGKKSDIQLVRELLTSSKQYQGTPYAKIMIEGNTGIYYASPAHLHSDYNKTRLFDKTPETLRLMDIFNKLNTTP